MKWLLKIGRFVATKIIPEISYPVLKGPLKGIKIIHGAFGGPSKGARIYFNLIEQKQANEFLNKVNEGDIVFDIGANVGYYTILSSKKVGIEGKVFSFEPVVRNLSYLYKHIILNRLENVVVLPLACSENSSLVEFSFSQSCGQGHLMYKDQVDKNIDFSSSTYVHTISIDEFVRISNSLPAVMKIDVEGAELSVLKGSRETLIKSKPKIFLSIHTEELEFSCIEYLKQFNYQFTLLDEKERPSVEYLCY